MSELQLPYEFASPRAIQLATEALTHSSASSTENNANLSRVGEQSAKAASFEMLYLSGDYTGSDYNAVLQRFTIAHLSRVGRRLGIDKVLVIGNGTYSVSDNMVAQALTAIFGAVKLSGGDEALQELLKAINL